MKKAFLYVTVAIAAISLNMPSAKAAALSLDGIDDWVSFPGTGVPTGADAFTIGAWINPNGPTSGGSGGQITFWGNQAGNQANGWRMRGPAGTRHYFWGNDHDEDFGSSIIDNTTGPNGDGWHHLAITWDGSETRQYWNGAPLGNPRAAAGINVADANYRIGNRLNAEYFDGWIDELSIWNVALDAATIGDGWNLPIDASNPAVSPFLVAYWDFENGLTDVAGGDNNGTFENQALVDLGANAPLIPEPSAVVLGLVGALLMLRRRRR